MPQSSDGLLQDIEESFDGTRLITHDRGYAPRLWDAKRQILLQVLSGHPDQIFQVTFSEDGKRIVTVSPTVLQVWDAVKAKSLKSISPPKEEGFWCAAISPDGRQIAIGLSKGVVAVGPVDDLLNCIELGKLDDGIWTVVWSPDGKSLLALEKNGKGSVFDVASRWKTDLTPHSELAPWGSFSPDGKYVLTSGHDNVAMLHDASSGELIQKYANVVGDRGIENVQMGAQFVGMNGEEIVCASDSGDLVLYDVGKAAPKAKMSGHVGHVREMRKSRNGQYLATYADDNTLRIWDVLQLLEMPLELEDGLPTAGEFSPNSPIWWLGYSEGEIRKFDVTTGKSTRQTYGAVTALGTGTLVSDSMLWLRSAHESGMFGGGKASQNLFLHVDDSSKALSIQTDVKLESLSPNGRYFAYASSESESGSIVVDLWKNKVVLRLIEKTRCYFTPDSAYVASIHEDGTVALWECATGESVWSWKWEIEKDVSPLSGLAFHPNGKWVVTGHHPERLPILWDSTTGKPVKLFLPFPDLISDMYFTPDGKHLTIVGWTSLCVYEVETANIVSKIERKEDGDWFNNVRMTADGRRLIATNNNKTVVLSLPNLETLFEAPNDNQIVAFNNDGSRIVCPIGPIAYLWDVDRKVRIGYYQCLERIVHVQFTANDQRILTIDGVGGASVFDANLAESRDNSLAAGEFLARLVLMKDSSWLVYDRQGRFDASDPSNVTGAYFVLDWEGGVEAIAMQQLKAQFYEPDLLSKALLIDKDRERDVPSLDSLRLYPEVAVTPGKKEGQFDVESKERDNGGIGIVKIALNGKQVMSKKSTAFFQFNLNDFQSFLLPATHIPDGGSNILTVTATNSKGDLESPPLDIDVGVPEGLRVPEIGLHGLVVGVGDYVGTTTDLNAPPSDANAIATALNEVANRLLPGRVDLTVMSTDQSSTVRPTRENILNWFRNTAAKSSSSDIIFVFFAGHGVSRIGDRAGYYFLTSEADPSDVTVASIGTSTISGDDLRDALAAIPANKQIVVLDTCHSGAAAESLIESSRSTSGDYQRAWEAIKDTTGTWLLAGSAADQRSYESVNVDHGLLTYSLLEAIDRATSIGLRETPSGELFVDVERWLNYAANRVDSLKSEVGLRGVQKPEFRRSTKGTSFDIGVMTEDKRGFLGLASPKPIVIVGDFEMDQEDPIGLEESVQAAMRSSSSVKAWFDVQKHPGVFRIAGTYVTVGGETTVKVFLQKFDEAQTRKTIATFEVKGSNTDVHGLATLIQQGVEFRIAGNPKT